MSTSDLRRTFHLPQDLVEDFSVLGIEPGMTVISHCSLSAIGMLVGGLRIYVDALLEVLGEDGTLVMPAHSEELSDPRHWTNPPVPESDHGRIREQMPAFEPDKSPTWGIGLMAEYFRNYPGVKRSYHPKDSFCAIGKHADYILEGQSLDYGLGDDSPLAKLYQLGSFILLAGAPMSANTSLHLAEYRATYSNKRSFVESSPISVDGRKQWVNYQEIEGDVDKFLICEKGLLNHSIAHHAGFVGNAASYLVEQRSCVDYFVGVLEASENAFRIESENKNPAGVGETLS